MVINACEHVASPQTVINAREHVAPPQMVINACEHVASPQMARLWLSVKVIQAALLFGPRIINCSQEGSFWQFIVKII